MRDAVCQNCVVPDDIGEATVHFAVHGPGFLKMMTLAFFIVLLAASPETK
jgi:hypothetical protein